MSILANLPVELVRDILELAAWADRPTARALTLTSATVRHWAEPALYHTVVLPTAPALSSFLAALATKPPEFARAHVRHLGIFAPGPLPSIARAVTACAGVRSLACGVALPSPHLPPDAAPQREQHLLNLACRDKWDAALIGRAVTHLRVQLPSFDGAHPDALFPGGGSLRDLPALTHLALVLRAPPTTLVPHLARLLEPDEEGGRVPLQLVLLQITGVRKDAGLAAEAVGALNAAAVAAGGAALRIVAEPAPLSVTRQWELAARDGAGAGVWDAAEGVVRARLLAAASAEAARTKIREEISVSA